MFFVLVPFLKRAPHIIIHLAMNVEKGGGVLMQITLLNLKHSFICPVPVPVPVPDSGFPCFPYAHTEATFDKFARFSVKAKSDNFFSV